MRNFVFKNELEFLFLKYHIPDKERYDIMTFLLKDSVNMSRSDKGKIYYLNTLDLGWLEILRNKTKNIHLADEVGQLLGLDDDLYMPPLLRQKIMGGEKVAVFVGAGVSKLLGYPLWSELGDLAIRFLRDNQRIDDFQCSRIQNEVKDPKQKLSIFENFITKGSEKHLQFFESNFSPEAPKPSSVSNPYDILVHPIFNWIKVTSNVDLAFAHSQLRLLNQQEERKQENDSGEGKIRNVVSFDDILLYDEAILPIDLDQNSIFHLHGVINHPASLTFTTTDYIRKYYDKDSRTNKFLRELFSNYSVVFMGYSLEELQILESVIGEDSKRTQRHFALFGTYLNEMNFFSIRKAYFDSLNIELQHYYLDFEQYGRLTRVLQSWQNELVSQQGKNIHDNINFIDRVLGNA